MPQVISADSTYTEQETISEVGISFSGYADDTKPSGDDADGNQIPDGSSKSITPGDDTVRRIISLPKTGDTQPQLAWVIGAGFICLGIYGLKKTNKKKQK